MQLIKFLCLQCPGEGVCNGSVQPKSGHPRLQGAPEGLPRADQGVCWRGHDGPVPGGEGDVPAPSSGGETQAPDVSARHSQPSRASRGDVRLKVAANSVYKTALKRERSRESKDDSC